MTSPADFTISKERWEFPGATDTPPPEGARSITLLSPSSWCLSFVPIRPPRALQWAELVVPMDQAFITAQQGHYPLGVLYWGWTWCLAYLDSQGDCPEPQAHEIGWDARQPAWGGCPKSVPWVGGDKAGSPGLAGQANGTGELDRQAAASGTGCSSCPQ